ncbi:hypothetical protein F5141DRAFT_1208961 [Pisolithus sp. B1]|nr:hypothetical protein F5141DRAFT_1208961 [Pisolithus sp. B1]
MTHYHDDHPGSTSQQTPHAILQPDDSAAVESARRRVAKKSRFHLFSYLRRTHLNKRLNPHLRGPHIFKDNCSLSRSEDDAQSITLSTERLPDTLEEQDTYCWAVLYENQRGLTIFSLPYYSSLSLLPNDPLPFTIPNAGTKRSQQPNVSLNNYPLPDATWRWVSKAWMIDMRSDLGEVQHDGFEYNWSFRETHWRAEIGPLSAGAWVRRRRWIRLMMRPANRKRDLPWLADNHSEGLASPLPSDVSPSETTLDSLEHKAALLWKGIPDVDWQQCYSLMKHLGSDGRKLELWRTWLDPYITQETTDLKGKDKQNSEARSCYPSKAHYKRQSLRESPPTLSHLSTMLQNHANSVIRMFIFPESRAQFLELLRRAGLSEDLSRMDHDTYPEVVGFWSYAGGFKKLPESSIATCNHAREVR